jgi:hypothetical protein
MNHNVQAEEYRSTSIVYNQPDGYVKRVELLNVDPTKHHHMILYTAPPGQGMRYRTWISSGDSVLAHISVSKTLVTKLSTRMLFVWSHAAPGYKFPPNAGFYVPRGSRLRLETHYLERRNIDPNGVRLVMTTKKSVYQTIIPILVLDW